MSYYNQEPAWSPAGRQGPWDQPSPAPRPTDTPTSPHAHDDAFWYQFASIDRAVEIWRKGSKLPADPRAGGGLPSRFPPAAEFDPRPMSGGSMQSFYQPQQRFGPRPGEVDPAVQAKRRMAAQRERDLRNYHQEQQFQKHLTGPPKSDRSMSPSTNANANANAGATGMTEDDRRDLIARQHRALYGNESNMYTGDPSGNHTISQDARVPNGNPPPGAFRGTSPYDAFGLQSGGPTNASTSAIMKQQTGDKEQGQRSRANSNSSPASNTNKNSYVFDNQQQSSRTSTTSPGGSPPHNKPSTSNNNVAPIGTRPAQQPVGPPQPGNLQKRSTTPLPSPLSYGFSADQGQGGIPTSSQENNNLRNGWATSGAAAWGGKGGLGVQAKVWG